MQFEFSANSLEKISADAIIVFASINDKDKLLPFECLNLLDKNLKGNLFNALKTAGFQGKRGEIFNYFPQDGILLSKKIIVLGLGKKSEATADDIRRSFGILAKNIKNKNESVSLVLPTETGIQAKDLAQIIMEGLMLGKYEFNKYKSTEKTNKSLKNLIISENNSLIIKEAISGFEKGKIYSEATILARDLVNEQSAVATPTFLADLALDIAKKDKKHIKCKVFDKAEAKKLGMDAFLGIARAAETAPKFIHLEYVPDGKNVNKEKLAIVGKGITFDSGGINVKTGDSMIDMKMDMSGAAVVLAVFSVITTLKPKFSVIGLIAATPNLISGASLVPGDVVKAMNGKTIEILNTDAEGRVTLADSLSYAVKEGATQILDFATLTGAVMVALGTEITGYFANNKQLSEKIKNAASLSGEKMWELPLEKDYKDINKSEVADIANIPNTRYGGSLTAALFLEEFIDNRPWAHFDIAGPAFTHKGTDISPKGGTGHGVRTVLNLLS